MMLLIVVAVFLIKGAFQPPWATAFKPLFSQGSLTHRQITEMAILRKTAEVCRDVAIAEGQDFNLTIDNTLTVFAVQKACSKLHFLQSTHGFQSAIASVYYSNAAVDVDHIRPERHCDAEKIREAQQLITDGLKSVKTNIDKESYVFARNSLGKICHTLQDFYSHSNWVELDKRVPFSKLINRDEIIDNIADANTKTCRNCNGDNCNDNILPELKEKNLLTSGYFGVFPSSKPNGKCSHGGKNDVTSFEEPTGGINKDEITSSHGIYHKRAADLAISATMELLEDIRLAKGNQAFLQLVGMNKTSVLAFVIDTTGSMSDDIEEAKRVSFNIIDSRIESAEKPSEYILVPFNDPDFGPLIKTRNAEHFKEKINLLKANGGDDEPEMCLSGLQLALGGAPPYSDIYVFTDAGAKDLELESTIRARIENTKSRVNFMLTKAFSFRKRRYVSRSQRSSTRMSRSGMQLYRDLADVSGGQAIEVTKSTLSQATTVITDSSASALVTVLQVVRNPAKAEKFSFVLDSSLSSVTMYITGVSPVFTLYNPTGVSQSGSVKDGPLGSIQTVGNLWRIQLNLKNQNGVWSISINSASPYTIKIRGQSSFDFIFNFVESEGLHGDFVPKDNRPISGGNGTLFLSVTGGEFITVTDVLLVEASGSNTVNGTIQSLGGSDYLIHLQRIPEWPFVVQLKGLLNGLTRSSLGQFQRQSSTQQRASSIKITADSQSTLKPGIPLNVNFTVTSKQTKGSYIIRARNDRGFNVSVPSSLSVKAGGSTQGTATLTPPSNTESGTDVTLTIEAEDPGSTDLNYVKLQLTVMAEITDVSKPVCEKVSIKADCPVVCSNASWELSANLNDGNGTGIAKVFINIGNGSLSTSQLMSEDGTNVTVAFYNASCCSPEVQVVAVDGVGNVGKCFTSIKKISVNTITTNTTVKPSVAATSSGGFVSFSKYIFLFILVVFFMW
ncbi:von Willebrand factor A domain-containing protein 7-like isoform X1 [Misgurnus anguillicaudatus]|uniref:von Willebrand factor A domain-containing protein 7-like isoform X1 n=1 Tax=Misgurnus anguillicaudatus TaxID=75329 RepID=UPI003CCF3D1D